MQIALEPKLKNEVKRASKTLGLPEKKFVNRALVYYLAGLEQVLDLKSEFEAWDRLSDESMRLFEQSSAHEAR